MKYEMVIDPNKWTKIADTQMENEIPYWCKMSDGRIVMAAHYSNGYSSGMGKCSVNESGIVIETTTFYLLRGSLVQPVIIN